MDCIRAFIETEFLRILADFDFPVVRYTSLGIAGEQLKTGNTQVILKTVKREWRTKISELSKTDVRPRHLRAKA
jgi:hypothetical protein